MVSVFINTIYQNSPNITKDHLRTIRYRFDLGKEDSVQEQDFTRLEAWLMHFRQMFDRYFTRLYTEAINVLDTIYLLDTPIRVFTRSEKQYKVNSGPGRWRAGGGEFVILISRG